MADDTLADLVRLSTLRDHPALDASRRALETARADLASILETATHAADVAMAAAIGDEPFPTAARTGGRAALLAVDPTLAAARAVVERAEARYEADLAALRLETEAAFIAVHRRAITRLAAALATAAEISHEVAALEAGSRRLLGGQPYERRPGRPLTRVAWTHEFGSSPGDETRLSAWVEFCARELRLELPATRRVFRATGRRLPEGLTSA